MSAIEKLLVFIAIVIGHIFAYVDSRPNFDDTGVLAFAIAITCAIIAFLYPRRPWLWAFCVGLWIPLHSILHNQGLASLLALVFAFMGAYVGAAIAKLRAKPI